MVQKTTRPSDRISVAAVIDPDAYGAGDVSSGWVSMADFACIMAIITAGDLGTNATLDAKLQQAQDASGTGAKDVTGAAITQLTQAGTDDSNKQAVINCWGEDLDVENNFTHVRLTISVGTATSDAGGSVLGLNPRFGPSADVDASTVAEVVSAGA